MLRAGLPGPRPPHLGAPCRCPWGPWTPARSWPCQDQEDDTAGGPGPVRAGCRFTSGRACLGCALRGLESQMFREPQNEEA